MADYLQLAIVAVVIAAFVVCGCLATRAKKKAHTPAESISPRDGVRLSGE
jgi:outer membrane murein-binding lipoprotein Lpp